MPTAVLAGEGMTKVYDPERVVLEVVLGRPGGRSRESIYRELPEVSPETIDAAISSLESAGLLRSPGRTVHATEALRRLEQLALLAL
jgi:hypothetical protein